MEDGAMHGLFPSSSGLVVLPSQFPHRHDLRSMFPSSNDLVRPRITIQDVPIVFPGSPTTLVGEICSCQDRLPYCRKLRVSRREMGDDG